MGRRRRIEYPGAFYHAMSRGNRSQAIYKDRKDLTVFLECLGVASEKYGLVIHSYCLMTNHYHLVVETPHGNLSAAIHWLNSDYARFFNRKHGMRGHLFQGRYKAIVVHAERYLTWLSRYVHLNPVRACMVSQPGEYRWSSYRAFTGKGRSPEWLQSDLVLGRFGRVRRLARSAYQGFVEGENGKGHDAAIANCLRKGMTLGDEAFVDSLEKIGDGGTLAARRWNRLSHPALGTVLEAVGTVFRVAEEDLLDKGHKRNLARDVAIYLVHRSCGLTGREIGAHFGDISPSAVSMRVRAVKEMLPWNQKLQRQVSRAEARLNRRDDSLSDQDRRE